MPTATHNMSATNGFTDSANGPDHFERQFGHLSDPEAARDSYQRIMHEHTKQQFQQATESSRRRSSGPSVASLRGEDSVDSVSST
ncbi:uncharacterized protein RCC_07208 [Ramularia collo-cygni]|uniref:Uncharacterized protein n=1 Tax=Ramularia collo-cygni TaxID=112498 RepID=A0A2D3V3S4_9PEZI|nr:uncharacterized protein RCC_07208 [Ramularia collo-cygni]CZT21345.1 uncharacterized protein RCC_07208 [Ramularia collo-cygni]